MQIRTFCLPYDPEAQTFDDEPLRSFLDGRDVLDLDAHLVGRKADPMWAVLVRYREAEGMGEEVRPRSARRTRASDLPQEARAVYEALRSWRNARAEREGRPPYVLLTNRQLAQIATRRPTTIAELGEVEGVGEARLQALGSEILATLELSTTAETCP